MRSLCFSPARCRIQGCEGPLSFGSRNSAGLRAAGALPALHKLSKAALPVDETDRNAKSNWAACVNHRLNVRNGALEGLCPVAEEMQPGYTGLQDGGGSRQFQCRWKRGWFLCDGSSNAWLQQWLPSWGSKASSLHGLEGCTAEADMGETLYSSRSLKMGGWGWWWWWCLVLFGKHTGATILSE